MADDDIRDEFNSIKQDADAISSSLQQHGYDIFDELSLAQDIDYLNILHANLTIYLIEPIVDIRLPVVIHNPEVAADGKLEYVFRIADYGDHYCTSADDLVQGTRATAKYLNTTQKMVELAVASARQQHAANAARAGEEDSGDGDIRLAFFGHDIGQRRAFQSCIAEYDNVMVTNFEPGEWGERQLRTMEYLAERGYLNGV